MFICLKVRYGNNYCFSITETLSAPESKHLISCVWIIKVGHVKCLRVLQCELSLSWSDHKTKKTKNKTFLKECFYSEEMTSKPVIVACYWWLYIITPDTVSSSEAVGWYLIGWHLRPDIDLPLFWGVLHVWQLLLKSELCTWSLIIEPLNMALCHPLLAGHSTNTHTVKNMGNKKVCVTCFRILRTISNMASVPLKMHFV